MRSGAAMDRQNHFFRPGITGIDKLDAELEFFQFSIRILLQKIATSFQRNLTNLWERHSRKFTGKEKKSPKASNSKLRKQQKSWNLRLNLEIFAAFSRKRRIRCWKSYSNDWFHTSVLENFVVVFQSHKPTAKSWKPQENPEIRSWILENFAAFAST